MKKPLPKTKPIDAKNFFDLSDMQKKRIIEMAARKSTKEQIDLLREHGYFINE